MLRLGALPACLRRSTLGRPAQEVAARFWSSQETTHPDFLPEAKAADGGVKEFIAKDVAQHPVLVYMKGTPSRPQCGFSQMVCRVLDGYDVPYASRNVLEDPDLREGIKAFTAWPTIPQVFISGEFVGGCDILMSMHKDGSLRKQLDTAKSS